MIKDNALQFLTTGIAIIPIKYRDKRPEFSLLPKNDEGKPSWEIYKTTLPSAIDVQNWFTVPRNYGVVAGWGNLVVLDFDNIQEYSRWLLWTSHVGGTAQQVGKWAYRVSTSRGVHVYIRLPHREKNRKLGDIDIKGDGYVLGPGSVHPSGAIYTPMRDVLNIPIVEALSDVLPSSLLLTEQNPASPSPQPAWAPTTQGVVGQGLVKKIRSAFKIEDYFPQAHKSGGRWMMAKCPLHDDHNPSFWIDTQRQICGCFAGCTPKPLDVINLFGRLHGLSNRDAIMELARSLT